MSVLSFAVASCDGHCKIDVGKENDTETEFSPEFRQSEPFLCIVQIFFLFPADSSW